jgi:hypothetical protein
MEWEETHDYKLIGRSEKTCAVISFLHGNHRSLWLEMLEAVKTDDGIFYGGSFHTSKDHPTIEDAKRAAEIIDAAYIPGKQLVAHWGDGKLIEAEAVDDDGRLLRQAAQVNHKNRLVCEQGAAAFDARVASLRAIGYEPSTEVKIFPGSMVVPGDAEPLPFLSQIMILAPIDVIDPELTPA